MKSTSFSIARVNRLRRAAERARTLPNEHPDPGRDPGLSGRWFMSGCDPHELVGVFSALRLHDGFALHAYEFRSGGNGNGIIWALPAGAPLLAPDDCPRLEDSFLSPPKPPGAVPLMQVIEGDGSPWSYLSASILWREAAEFGARWHGCSWSDQTILSKPPRQADGSREWKLTGDAPVGDWNWHTAVPRRWEPACIERGTTREVVLYIRNPVGTDRVYRATDAYRAGNCDPDTRDRTVCTGEGGIIY